MNSLFNAVEPLLSGTITGPAVNGTITGGLAYPPVLYNQTLQVPNINIYGTTSDGYPFFATELGVGTPSEQITRLVSSLPTALSNFAPIHPSCYIYRGIGEVTVEWNDTDFGVLATRYRWAVSVSCESVHHWGCCCQCG